MAQSIAVLPCHSLITMMHHAVMRNHVRRLSCSHSRSYTAAWLQAGSLVLKIKYQPAAVKICLHTTHRWKQFSMQMGSLGRINIPSTVT